MRRNEPIYFTREFTQFACLEDINCRATASRGIHQVRSFVNHHRDEQSSEFDLPAYPIFPFPERRLCRCRKTAVSSRFFLDRGINGTMYTNITSGSLI